MVEMVGPTNLLDFCSQKLSEFLGNAEHKHLAWLREIEEEAVKMFDRLVHLTGRRGRLISVIYLKPSPFWQLASCDSKDWSFP